MKPLLTLLLLLSLSTTVLAAADNSAMPLTRVTLQLKWYHQFQFAGYYAALEQGYYREAGLDVTIREGSPERNPVEDVVAGKAEFGIGASDLLLARARGEPIVAVAAVIQHSPLILLARRNEAISSFHDLVGKRIEFVPHEYELFAFFQAMGFSRDDFTLIPRAGSLDALLNGEVEAVAAYSTDEPFELQQHNIDYLTITPRSAGVDFYGDTLFTSEQMLEHSPQTVAAFRQASLRGWRYALNHPEAVARLIRQHYNPKRSLEHLLFEAHSMEQLILPNLVELGYMNPGRWQHIAESYRRLNLLEHEVDLKRFLYREEHEQDLGWLYWSTASALLLAFVVLAIAGYILRLNHRLRLSEERYRVLYNSAPMAIIAWDGARRLTAWNRQAEQIFGWRAEEVLGRDFFDFLVPVEEAEHVETVVGTIHKSHGNIGSQNWNLTKSGKRILCEWMNTVLEDSHGEVTEVVALAIDITEKNRIQESLRRSEERHRLLAENVLDVIWTMDLEGRFTFISPSIKQLRGYSVAEAMAQSLEQAFTPPSYSEIRRALHEIAHEGGLSKHHWELEYTCKDGDTVWTDVSLNVLRDDLDRPLEIVGVTRNATERRKLEGKLQAMAHHDALTGLPNRTLFFDRLQQAINMARRNRHRVGLLFIDLDGFKQANDNYGHEYGDALLCAIARRLEGEVRESDTVARMGGDEFTVILQRVNDPEDCANVAAQLLDTIARPFEHDGQRFQLAASIGISLYPDDSEQGETLLNLADKAMYRIKRGGKNAYGFTKP